MLDKFLPIFGEATKVLSLGDVGTLQTLVNSNLTNIIPEINSKTKSLDLKVINDLFEAKLTDRGTTLAQIAALLQSGVTQVNTLESKDKLETLIEEYYLKYLKK